jgi:DNA-binding GntR family transcriptional regulator
MLVNFSFQTTLGELREKLERLNEYHADDALGNQEIVNIFHELHGQICGNARVLAAMPELADKLEKMLKSAKPIAEPRKRAMVSELREVLKNLNVGSIENYVGAN